mmetsp:Transcript_124601/g.311607  ORF Transcript_124601/g.311607 Transcript_124601/m.311607 type:complete len:197 (-) Transcript_124601:253-843(-)
MPAQSRGYSFPVDVWAAGLCMYMAMFGGRHPFLDANGELNPKSLLAGSLNFAKRSGILGTVGLAGAHMSAAVRGLCQRMVTVDPHLRITAQSALDTISDLDEVNIEPIVSKISFASLFPPSTSTKTIQVNIDREQSVHGEFTLRRASSPRPDGLGKPRQLRSKSLPASPVACRLGSVGRFGCLSRGTGRGLAGMRH